MSDDPPDVEQALRSLKWRAPAEGVLESSLKAALAERASVLKSAPWVVPRRGSILHLIPRAVRWPLAACWIASLFFWWCTPREAPSPSQLVSAEKRKVDPALLLAGREATRLQTHELLLALERHEQCW